MADFGGKIELLSAHDLLRVESVSMFIEYVYIFVCSCKLQNLYSHSSIVCHRTPADVRNAFMPKPLGIQIADKIRTTALSD